MAKKKPKVSLAARRGLFKEDSGNSWFMTLVQVPGQSGPVDLDEVVDRLIAAGGVGASRRDVGADLLAGRLATPSGPWALLVALPGQSWGYLLPGAGDNDGQSAANARRSGLRTIATGYQDTANATSFECHEGDEVLVAFETCGMEDEDDADGEGGEGSFGGTKFRGSRYPAGWIKRYQSETKAVEALAKDLDAFVPFLGAGDFKDVITIFGSDRDEFDPGDYLRIDLLGFGAARLEPSAADRRLRDALAAADPAAIRAAVAEGADLRSLPGSKLAPIRHAIGSRHRGQATPRELIETLLALGAAADTPGEEPSILAVLDGFATDEAAQIDLIEPLVTGGADINARGVEPMTRGQTPLHVAAAKRKIAVAKYLIAHGADLAALDAQGLTPRLAAEALRVRMRQMFGNDSAAAGASAMLDLLTAAEAGRADLDWRTDAEETARLAYRRAAEMKRAFGGIGASLKALGAVMQDDVASQTRVDAAVLAQPEKISLVPADDSPWATESSRHATAEALGVDGFAAIGRFTIPELPRILLEAFHDPATHHFAVVYDASGQSFIDLIRYHVNMTRLTVTNNRSRPEAQFATPNRRTIRLPGAPVADLLAALRADLSAVAVEPVPPGEFAGRFERAYLQEMKARRRAIRRARA